MHSATTVLVELRIGLFEFTTDAILYLIEFLVNIPICITALPEFLRRKNVMGVSRTNKVVDGKIEQIS